MIHHGDCLEVLKTLPDNSVDSRVGVKTEFGRAWVDSSGHFYVSRKKGSRWTTKPLHVLVYEKAHGKVPQGMDVHHVDHNPANNELSNLVCITKSDHRRIHAGWLKTDGEWSHKPCTACREVKPLSEFRKAKRGEFRPQAECKKCDNLRRVRRARAKRQAVSR